MARNRLSQPNISGKQKSKRRRLAIETLEARINPAPSPLTYTSPGASSLTLKLSGATLQIVDASNNVVASKALVDTSGVVITGATGATDTLLVDYENGGFFAPTNGVQFNAGTGGTDALTVRGDATLTAVYTPATTGGGTVAAKSGTVTTNVVATGLEDPVKVVNTASLIYRTPGPTNVLTIDSPTSGSNRVSGTSGGTAMHPLSFSSIPTVTVDTATNDGNLAKDAVTLAAPGFRATGLQNFTVDTGIDTDTLTIGAASVALPVGGGSFLFKGGSEEDTIVWDRSADTQDDTITLTASQLTVAGAGSIDLNAVENASLTGGSGNDTFDLNQWTGKADIVGGSGRDNLFTTGDDPATINSPSGGSPGNRTLTLYPKNNSGPLTVRTTERILVQGISSNSTIGTAEQASMIAGIGGVGALIGNLSQTEELGRSFPVTDANLARLSGMKAALNELASRLGTYLNGIRNLGGGGTDVGQSDVLSFLKGTEVSPPHSPLTFTFTDPDDPNIGQVTATVTGVSLEELVSLDGTKRMVVRLSLSTSRTSSISLSAAQLSSDLGFSFKSGSGNVALTTTGQLDFAVDFNDPSTEAVLDLDKFQATSSTGGAQSISGSAAQAAIGFLGVHATGSVNLNASVPVLFIDPTPETALVTSDINPTNPPTDYATTFVYRDTAGHLPGVTDNYAAVFTTTVDPGIKFFNDKANNPNEVNASDYNGKVQIGSTDFLHAPLSIQFFQTDGVTPHPELRNFTYLTPESMLGLLQQLQAFLGELGGSSVLAKDIPFAAPVDVQVTDANGNVSRKSLANLGDVLDFGRAFQQDILQKVTQATLLSDTNVTLPAAPLKPGVLTANDTFTLTVNGKSVPVTVASSVTSTNQSLSDLAADVQTAITSALATASVTGVTPTVLAINGRLQITLNGVLGFGLTADTDPTKNQLGFGASVHSIAAPLFIDAQGLASLISSSLSAVTGTTVTVIPEYDAFETTTTPKQGNSLTFKVDWSHTFSDVKLPVDFGSSLGDFSGVAGAPSVLVQSSTTGAYAIHFTNALGRQNIPLLTVNGASLTGGAVSVVETTAGTTTTDEVQTLMVTATGGTFTVTYGGQTTDPLLYNATALAIQQALQGLAVIRDLGALPVTATTRTQLVFGVDLVATPQAKLGLTAATPAGNGIDPDLIVAAPLATQPVQPLGLTDNAGSTSVLVNGRRLDLSVPAATSIVQVQAIDHVMVDHLILGYSSMAFSMTVGGTPVSVTIPSESFDDLVFSGNPFGRVLENLNDAVARGLAFAGLAPDLVRVSLSPIDQLQFTTSANAITVSTTDSRAMSLLGLTSTLTSGPAPLITPTLIAEKAVNTVVPGELSADANFTLMVDAATLDVQVRKQDTLGNRDPLAALAADVQTAVNVALGTTKLNDPQRVRVQANSNGKLQFFGPTSLVNNARITISATNSVARDELGLSDGQTISGNVGKSVKLTADRAVATTQPGQLDGDATFSIAVNGSPAKAVTINRANTFDNASPIDGLVADVQAAVDRVSPAGVHVTVSRIGQTLVFSGPITTAPDTALLGISAVGTDTAVTELGLGETQTGTSQADANRVARVQVALDTALLTIGLNPGDVVVRADAGTLVYQASSPAVYDVAAPTQVLSPTQTPPDGVLGGAAHVDLFLNDVDTIHVTVPSNASNATAKPSLTGDANGTTPLAVDGEFVLTAVITGGTSRTMRVTVQAADALSTLGFTGITSSLGVVAATNVLTATKLTADATFRLGIDVTNPGGGVGNEAVSLTIFAAETANNTTPRDLVDDLNAAIGRAGRTDRVFATLDAAGHVVFKAIDPDTGALTDAWVTVSPAKNAAGTTTASLQSALQGAISDALADAGMAGTDPIGVGINSTTGAITLTANAASTIRAIKINVPTVDTEAQRQTTGLGFHDGDADSPVRQLAADVQGAINSALTAYGHGYAANDVLVYTLGDVSADTSRLALGAAKTGANPIFSMRLIAKRGDTAVTRLGFDDLNPPATARPVELAARARSDNFFLRDATLSGSMTAAKTNLPVTGTYGFVGFDGLADINVTADPVRLAFVNPAGSYPKIKLGDLRTAVAQDTLDQPATSQVTLGGTATASVGVVPGDNLLGPTPRPAAFTVGNWAKDDTAVSVDARGLGDLAMFRSLRLPAVLTALHQVADYLRGLNDPRLDASLPLVNKSVKELLDFAGQFDNFVTAIGTAPIPNMQAMAALIKGALGYPLNSDQVAFRLDNSVAGKPALRLDLLFLTGGVQSYSLDLDVEQLFRLSGSPDALDDIKRVLKGNSGTEVPYLRLTALNSGGKIDAGALATLRLSLGFDLSTAAATGLDVTVPQESTVATIPATSPFAPTAAGELSGDSTFRLTITGPRTDAGTATVTVPVTVPRALTQGAADSTALAALIQAQINDALKANLLDADLIQDPNGPPVFHAGDVVVGTRDVTVAEGGLPSIAATDTAAGIVTTGRGIDLQFVRTLGGQNVGAIGVDGSALVKQGVDATGKITSMTPSLTLSTVVDGHSSAPATNEIQRLVIDATGGTFTLRFNGDETAPIPFNATADAIGKVLAALPTLAAPEHAWTVTFTGAHRRQAIPLALTANVDQLFTTDGSAPRVLFDTTVTGGPNNDEVRVIEVDAAGGTFSLNFGGNTTVPIPFNASGDEVAAALGAIVGGNTIKIYSRTDTLNAIHIDADPDDPFVRQLHFTGHDDGNAQLVIAGSAFDERAAGELRGDSVFTLEILKGGATAPTTFDVVLHQADTAGVGDVSLVVSRFQQALDAALVANGFAAGDVTINVVSNKVTIAANPSAAIKSIRLLAPTDSPARAELGLGAVQDSGATSPAVAVAPNKPSSQRPGILSAPATFDIRITDATGSVHIPVLIAPNGANVGTDDLLVDVQKAVATALTAAGRSSSDVLVAIGLGGTLEFTGATAITGLRITTTGGNPVQTQLGFDGDQSSDSGNLGLDDLRMDVQAAVDSALTSTSGFRLGDVVVGIESTPTGGTIRFGRKGELGFGPVQEATGTALVPAVIQGFAPISTPRSGVLSAAAGFNLQMTIGGVTKSLTVSVPVDAANTRTADLIADVQAALNAQLTSAGIAGTVTVGMTPADFTAPGVARDNFLTLTGAGTVTALKLTRPADYLTPTPPTNDLPASGRLASDLVTAIGLAATSPSLEPFLYDGLPATNPSGLQIGGTELKVETKFVSQGPGVQVTQGGTAADPFWLVEFVNGFGKQNVSPMGVDDTGVLNTATSLGKVHVTTIQEGSDTQNEIQKITLENAHAGFFVLAFEGETTEPISLGTLAKPEALTAVKIEQGLVGLDNLGAAFTAVIGPVAFKAKRAEALLDSDGFADTTTAASFTLNLANTNNLPVSVTVDPYTTQATLIGGTTTPANGVLGSNATFNLDFTRASQPGVVQHLAAIVNAQPANTTRDQLVADAQAALDAALIDQGLSIGEVVASLTSTNKLRLSGGPRDGVLSLSVSSLNGPAATGLGLSGASTTSGNMSRPVLGGAQPVSAPSGVLSTTAEFTLYLTVNGNPIAPIVVDVNRDTSNTSLNALVADMQAAINPLLTARGFAAGDVTVGLTAGNVLTLTGNPLAGITALRVSSVDTNTSRTQLGLPADDVSASDNGLTDLMPDIQAAINTALIAAGRPSGDVVVGFVPATNKLTFTPKTGSTASSAKVVGGSDALPLPTNGQLTQPFDLTLLLNLAGGGDSRHSLNTSGEAAADTSLAVVGGMSLDLPLYNVNADETAGGLALHLPNLDAFFKTQDPVSPTPLTGTDKVTFTNVPDFSQAEVPIPITNPNDAQLALIDDPGLIFDGLENYFDNLQGQIDSQAGNGQMPLLGGAAKGPLQFVTDLKESVLTKMKDTWSKLLGAPDPVVSPPTPAAPAGITTMTPEKDSFVNPPDRIIDPGTYVSEIIPNDAQSILVENWGHLGRSFSPFTTLQNTIYNLFGPTPERVKNFYGIVSSRDSVTVNVNWDETQGLHGEPTYTTRQQLLDKYQEHLLGALTAIGYYQINGQPTVKTEFGPSAETGEPNYKFTPQVPAGGYSDSVLNGDWNEAKSLLYLFDRSSTGAGTAADPAVLTGASPIYTGATPQGLLDGGFAPLKLNVTSSNYSSPVSLFLDLSERGALAYDLQTALDNALTAWTAGAPGRATYANALKASISSTGRLTIAAGDARDGRIATMSVTAGAGAKDGLGYSGSRTVNRIRMSNTSFAAAVTADAPANFNGLLNTPATLTVHLVPTDGTEAIDLTIHLTRHGDADKDALIGYVQSVVDGALDNAGKAALAAGDVTVGMTADKRISFTGSPLAKITALQTDIPARYKTINSVVILGSTDFAPTPIDGVIQKGFNLSLLELWINTPAPGNVSVVSPLRTGKAGTTEVDVSAVPDDTGTWDLNFTGSLATHVPTVAVRSNAKNPLKKVSTIGGVKTLVDATVTYTPTPTGGIVTTDATEGGFDFVLTFGDGRVFESNMTGGVDRGVAPDASVDDVAAALAGPNTTTSVDAMDLLKKKDATAESDTGVVALSEPPPTPDDVEVATDLFKTYDNGPLRGLPVVPFQLVDNPTVQIGFKLGEQNLLERFAKKEAARLAKDDPSKVNANGDILLGNNVRLLPDVPGVGTVIVPPKVSANSGGFGVDLDVGLAARIGWEVNIGFGVSKNEKFFLNTATKDEVKLDLRLGLASNTIDGPATFSIKLGPLVGTARDQFPTAPYSTFLMDLNLSRYRVPVAVDNYKKNTLLAYTGTSINHPQDLLSDLNTALKGFLPTIGFKTDDVVASYHEIPLTDLQDQLSAALGQPISLGTVTVAAVAGATNQFDVTFGGGRFAGINVDQLTAQDTALAQGVAVGHATIATQTAGGSGTNEVQRITIDASAGTYTLTYGGQTTVPIKFDATAAEIQEALNALSGFRGIPATIADATGAQVALTLQQQALARNIYATQFELRANPDPHHQFRQRVTSVGLVPAGLQLDPKLNGKLLADREDGDPNTPAPFPQNALFQDDASLLPTSLAFSVGVDIRDPDKNKLLAIPNPPADGVLKKDVTIDLVVKKTTAIEAFGGSIGGNAALIGSPTETFKLPGIVLEKKYTDGSGVLVGTKLVAMVNHNPEDLAKDIQDAIDRYLNNLNKITALNASQRSAIKQAIKPGDITVTFNEKTKAFEFEATEGGSDGTTRARRANIREVDVDADGERLSVAELIRNPKDAFQVHAEGNLNVNAQFEISFKRPTEENTNPLLPKFTFDLALDKPLFSFDTDLNAALIPAGGPATGSKPFPTPSNGRLDDDVTVILLLGTQDGKTEKWPVVVRSRDTFTPKLNPGAPDAASDNQDLSDLQADIQRAVNLVLTKNGLRPNAVTVTYDTKSGQFLFKKSTTVRSFITTVSYQLKLGETKLQNVAIDLGSFIGDMAGPILQKADDIVKPFDWLIGDEGLLTRRLPVISDLNGRNTSLLDLAGQFGSNKTAKTLSALREIRSSVKSVKTATKDAKGSVLPLGTIKLDGTGNGYQTVQGSGANGAQRNGTGTGGTAPVDKPGPAKNFFANTQRGSFALGFPILTEPRLLFDAIALGKYTDLTVVTLGLPHFEFNFQYEQRFQIFGPLFATLGGFFSASIDVGIGFDMSGVAKYQKTGRIGDIFDGFYISDRTNPNGSGADRPELTFTGGIVAGAELNLGVASAGVQGGITATVDFNLDDPNNDGRVRLSEMLQNIQANDNNPAAIFDIGGRIGWFFRAYVTAFGGLFNYSKDLGAGTLFEFTVPFKRLPVLAVVESGGILVLNTGPLAPNRIHGPIDGNAGDSFVINYDSTNADGSLNLVVKFGGAQVTYENVRSVEATGGAGNDTYDFRGVTQGSLTAEIHGGGGDDNMYAGVGSYTFIGEDGNDHLVGGAGNDLLDGSAGDDSLAAGAGDDSVTGGLGNDTVDGGDGNNTIDGAAGNDVLMGGAGIDDYVFADGWGDDTVTDGGGIDAFDFRNATAALTFRVSSNGIVKQTAVTDFTSRVVSFDFDIELLLGGRGADKYNIAATGASGLVLDGGRGSDTYTYDLTSLATGPIINDSGPIWNTDTLVLNGTGDAETYNIDSTRMTVHNLAMAGSPTVPIDYTGGGIEAVEVDAKGGDDVINVGGTDPELRYTVNAGEGDDTVNVGVDLVSGAPTDLSQVRGHADTGPLLVRGNGGRDAINLYDSNDSADIAGTLTPSRLLGLGMRQGIKYLSFEDLHLVLGAGNNTFTVEGTHASQRGITGIPGTDVLRTTTIDAGAGEDNLLIKTIASETTVNGEDGNDTFYVADDLTTTDQIFSTLFINGGTSTTNDVLTVDDSEDRSPNVGVLTSSTITGLDMEGEIDYLNLEELHLHLGQGPDVFNVRSTLATTPVSLTGGGGNDIITVANTSKSLADIRGGLNIDAGEGVNQLIYDNRGATAGAHAVVNDDKVLGFAPVTFYYEATGGTFDSPTGDPFKGSGVLLRGSTTARDAFFAQSTLAGSTTAIEGGGGDVYYVAALPPVPVAGGPDVFPVVGNITDNGNLDEIRGRLHIVSPLTTAPSALYVDDHGNTQRANYTVGNGMVQNFVDPTNPASARPDFAGVDFDPGIRTLRVDATDDVNVFDAKPSPDTQILINANLPIGGHPIVGGGDYLRLDTTGTKGRLLHITSPGNGFWSFKGKTLPLTFESIERFNHVDAIGYNGDVGKKSPAPYVTVRDAENGVLKFAKMAYAGSFRGGVRWAFADMNYDGLPDLVTVSGAGRTAEVHVYDGSPDAKGKYKGTLLTNFPVLPANVKTGAFIALGDINHDGANDIVIGADAGWVPQVSVFDGLTALTTHTELVPRFNAFAPTFRGGVRVAVGDLDETDGSATSAGRAEIVTATGRGTIPTVAIYDLSAADQIEERRRYYPFPSTMTSPGLFIAVGDYNGDHIRDVIVTPGPGVAPRMNIFSGKGLLTRSGLTETPTWSIPVKPTSYRGGLAIIPIPKNGGNPGSVEWDDLRVVLGPK
ncbi:MAG TPA: hypothetical protein VHR66_19505 [Gemmataceae bacterium]|nr:hypothetical protein [Gemmataceae bacterium]